MANLCVLKLPARLPAHRHYTDSQESLSPLPYQVLPKQPAPNKLRSHRYSRVIHQIKSHV